MTIDSLASSLLPTVALVGRPNVGKSTLFNVLTNTRDALVGDRPGLTRDRQYGRCELATQPFLLVDTGGINEKPQDALAKLMAEQSMQATEEAELIVFVVDAKDGLTSEDTTIAKRLRKLNKPVILVINKADVVKDPQADLAEFFRLGFKHSCLISAAHRRGIHELNDAILQYLPQEEASDELSEHDRMIADSIKVAVIGRPNVGKSTLINRILGEERVVVFDMPGTTRDSIFIPFSHEGKNYTLIDTAGVRRRGKITDVVEKFSVIKTMKAMEAANVVVMVFDAKEGITDQDLHVLGYALDAGKSLIVAFNKWDGLPLDHKEYLQSQIDFRLSFVDFAKIMFISALHGTGVGHLFEWIDKVYESAMVEVSTAKVTELLEQAIARHQPPLVKGRRVKLRYAHLGGHNPPTIVIHGTQAKELPMSYQRYLQSFYRDKLKLIGTPVKLELRSPKNPYDPD